MEIRKSHASEIPLIETIHLRAFGEHQGEEIARLAHDLFDDPTAQPLLSLACVTDAQLSGHILFTNVTVEQTHEDVSARILAPLAVLPEQQGKGIGAMLIQEGLRQLRKSGVDIVFVLGHPEYYPRSGFTPAGVHGFDAPFPIPAQHANAWMLQGLRPGIAKKAGGKIKCADVLNRPEHWRE